MRRRALRLQAVLGEVAETFARRERLWLQGVGEVLLGNQESLSLVEVQALSGLQAAGGAVSRWGRRDQAAVSRLRPADGEPVNGASGRAGAGRRAGLPGGGPQVCESRDHGDSLCLATPH